MDDENLFIEHKGKDKFALDYSIILYSENDINYFFDGVPSNLADLSVVIARSWYRNSDNIDTHTSQYSSGMLLEKRISFMVTNIIKFYYSFSELTKQYEVIEVPSNHPKFLDKILNIFKQSIRLTSEQVYSEDLNVSINQRAVLKKIKVNKYSSIFRFLQKPFVKLMRNKIMVFPDWTYMGQKNKNYLYQNGLNIFNSFYYRDVDKKNNNSISRLPDINSFAIQSLLSEHNIKPNDSDNLLALIEDIISIEYLSSIETLEQQYFVMKDLINHYQPSKLIIPDDGEYASYNMLMQIASQFKIESVSVLDGYVMFLDVNQIRVKEDGVTPLAQNYATMGSLSHEMVGSIYPKYNRILIKAPLLSYLPNRVTSKKIYDALVMIPIPNPFNPNNRWDMRSKYIIDIIECLKSMKIDKIGVKVKPGPDLNDTKFLENYFFQNNIHNIEFVRGFGYDAISKSSIVIGQLATSTYESLVMKIPYFIYEPKECGLTEINMKNSIVNDKYIARSIKDLSENIFNGKDVKILIEGLIDGSEMSSTII